MSDNRIKKFIKKHKIIGLDSMLFIYQFEQVQDFWPKTNFIFELLEKDQFQGITSIICLIEILTQPKKKKDYFLVNEYQNLIKNFPHLELKEVNFKVADLASSLRAEYNLTTPDAIMIATSLLADATGFITADAILARVKELEVLVIKK